MIAEAFLVCALAAPAMSHTHGSEPLYAETISVTPHYALDKDDASFFRSLTVKYREAYGKEPPIFFAYNYYQFAELLRVYGLRAYSMTVAMTGGHLNGLTEDLPIQPESLAMYVLFQKTSYISLFQTCDAIAVHGSLLIDELNLPYMADVILSGLGFTKTFSHWHNLRIYQKKQSKSFLVTFPGFDAFTNKKVVPPYQVHRGVLYHAKMLIQGAA